MRLALVINDTDNRPLLKNGDILEIKKYNRFKDGDMYDVKVDGEWVGGCYKYRFLELPDCKLLRAMYLNE